MRLVRRALKVPLAHPLGSLPPRLRFDEVLQRRRLRDGVRGTERDRPSAGSVLFSQKYLSRRKRSEQATQVRAEPRRVASRRVRGAVRCVGKTRGRGEIRGRGEGASRGGNPLTNIVEARARSA